MIEQLSRGGLTAPNNNLVSLCKKLDSQFILFHGDKIDMEPEPIERLLNVILSELPRDHETAGEYNLTFAPTSGGGKRNQKSGKRIQNL